MRNADIQDLNGLYPAITSGGFVYIYALLDPETLDARYIGKSIRPIERLTNHLNSSEKCHRANWLRSLKKQGKKPVMVILERVSGDWPWQESERYWIDYGRRLGWPLTNGTDGVDGVSGLSEESRRRMAEAWRGRNHKPESLLLIGAASRARRHSASTKAKMSKAHTGRSITWGDAISKSLRKLSEQDVLDIASRLGNGDLGVDLSREYGVHRTTISKIKMGTYYDKDN